MKKLFPLAAAVFLLLQGATVSFAGFTVDHTSTDLNDIPEEWITKAKEDLHIAYNHTSHGSQLITGMNALKNFPEFLTKYSWEDESTGNTSTLSLDDKGIPGIADLSQGDTDSNGDGIAKWAEDTSDFLEDSRNNHINVIMWSWCDINRHDIPRYLRSMQWLIDQFSSGGSHNRAAAHPVQFVYITAHANGGGLGDSADSRNELIRAHCSTNDCILFDFSDIENYDPDNNYFLPKLLRDDLQYDSNGDNSRDANWASEYLVRHSTSELYKLTKGDTGYSGAGRCSHSDGPNNDARLNCVLKGRAAWHLFARLAGWNPDTPVPPNPNPTPNSNAAVTSISTFLLSGN